MGYRTPDGSARGGGGGLQAGPDREDLCLQLLGCAQLACREQGSDAGTDENPGDREKDSGRPEG